MLFWNISIHAIRRQAWSYWSLDAKSWRPVKWSEDPKKSLKDPTRKGNLHDLIYVESKPDGLRSKPLANSNNPENIRLFDETPNLIISKQ